MKTEPLDLSDRLSPAFRKTVPSLGVDPGRGSGAAYLLGGDGRTCLGWWAWKLMKRKDGEVWRCRWIIPDFGMGEYDYESMTKVGHWIRQTRHSDVDDYQLTVEGLFVPRAKQHIDVRTVIALAEATGEVLGPLRAYAIGPVLRPKASEWRPRTAGIPAKRDKHIAENEAVHKVMNGIVVECPPHLKELTQAELGAVCEAACIARDGWAMRNTDPWWVGRRK